MPDRELEASHCYSGDSVAALMDGKLPKSSSDHGLPRMTFWPHKGVTGRLYCRFDKLRALSRSAVYWFDDGPKGGCRDPASWRLLYRDGESWTPVHLTKAESYGLAKDGFQHVRFTQVQTREWMLARTIHEIFVSEHEIGVADLVFVV